MKWGLNEYVSIALAAYTVPTGILLMICCTHIEKLANVSEIWLYIMIAGGGSLIYTALSSLEKMMKDK